MYSIFFYFDVHIDGAILKPSCNGLFKSNLQDIAEKPKDPLIEKASYYRNK
jgi:hypothetical protein